MSGSNHECFSMNSSARKAFSGLSGVANQSITIEKTQRFLVATRISRKTENRDVKVILVR